VKEIRELRIGYPPTRKTNPIHFVRQPTGKANATGTLTRKIIEVLIRKETIEKQ